MALKSPQEIAQMREAGLLVWQAHQVAAAMIKPGVTTGAIDAAVEMCILDHHAQPLFKGVPGKIPFPATTCISVNEEVVHGIPGQRVLVESDIVSVDIGCRRNGWCGDAAVTHPVGAIAPHRRALLDVTENALRHAILLLRERRRWSEVAREMERFVHDAGFFMVEDRVGGHGIGRQMHEDPHVPNRSSRAFERSGDFVLEPGLVIAVEPMVNSRTSGIRILADGWTAVASDGQPSAHFEHTIALTTAGPQVLTAGPDGAAWSI